MTELTSFVNQRNKSVGNRLIKAYVGLVLTPQDERGWRTVSVARFGVYEVRLVEAADRGANDGLDFWIELFRHDTRSSIDSCHCWDLDEAEHLAEHLIQRAKQLYKPAAKFRALH